MSAKCGPYYSLHLRLEKSSVCQSCGPPCTTGPNSGCLHSIRKRAEANTRTPSKGAAPEPRNGRCESIARPRWVPFGPSSDKPLSRMNWEAMNRASVIKLGTEVVFVGSGIFDGGDSGVRASANCSAVALRRCGFAGPGFGRSGRADGGHRGQPTSGRGVAGDEGLVAGR